MNTHRFLFTGDFAPCRAYSAILEDSGIEVFGELTTELRNSDFAFLNLECPLTYSTLTVPKDGPSLKAPPSVARVIKEAGFSCVGLANNHILDFQGNGLIETTKALDNLSLMYCGAGKDIWEASAPVLMQVGSKKIAIFAVSESEFNIASDTEAGAAPIDVYKLTLDIINIKNSCDLIFVTVHGGNEFYEMPRPGLKKLCRYLIDIGVDGIFCHHPHVPGPFEIYKSKPIVYSLGNLIFDHSKPPEGWNSGYAFVVIFNDDNDMVDFEVIPYTQSVESKGLVLSKNKDKENFLKYINNLNSILLNDDSYTKNWNEYCVRNADVVFTKTFFPLKFKGVRKLYPVLKYIYNSRFFRSKKIESLNSMRCESHLELIKTSLELNVKRNNKN
ncbi:CapA family protein [Providencia manganoxydans]|uniref:CapA family protein n=1 Tax=Providencia manganoxydans TaxID=2923283 RepID=UPI0034DD9739